jgi:hypothetical protein
VPGQLITIDDESPGLSIVSTARVGLAPRPSRVGIGREKGNAPLFTDIVAIGLLRTLTP